MTGEHDRSYPPEILEKTHEKLPDSRLEIVDSDHEYFYEKTRDFYERWDRFVGSQ